MDSRRRATETAAPFTLLAIPSGIINFVMEDGGVAMLGFPNSQKINGSFRQTDRGAEEFTPTIQGAGTVQITASF